MFAKYGTCIAKLMAQKGVFEEMFTCSQTTKNLFPVGMEDLHWCPRLVSDHQI